MEFSKPRWWKKRQRQRQQQIKFLCAARTKNCVRDDVDATTCTDFRRTFPDSPDMLRLLKPYAALRTSESKVMFPVKF